MAVAHSISAMTMAGPSHGWMLLHHAESFGDPQALFDRLGLKPDGARLTFGGTNIEWVAGEQALSIAGSMASGCTLIGLATAPDLSSGHLLAMRLAAGEGEFSAAILRLCTTAGLIAAAVDATSIGWVPARLWSSVALFSDAIVATERQELPPVMHLVAFDVAEAMVESRGLAWFCGHELRLSAPSGYPEREALRRAARLAVDALMHDGLVGPMTVAGIDKGETLTIGRRVDAAPVPYVPVELHPPPG